MYASLMEKTKWIEWPKRGLDLDGPQSIESSAIQEKHEKKNVKVEWLEAPWNAK